MEDFYELLGVPEDASADEIDRAWRESVRRYHPDVNDDDRANAQFKTLQTAHEVLTDADERAAYDRLGHETYVRERLDGLPTARHPSGSTGAGRDGGSEPGDGTRTGSGGTGTAGGGARSRRREAGRRGRGGSADASGSTGASRSGSSGRTRASGTATGTGDRTGGRTRSAGSTSARRRRRPRRPLAYGWGAVAVATLCYLGGLWAYLGANAAALAALLESGPAAVPSLLRTSEFVAPGTFVLDAAAAGAVVPLLLGVGAVGLAAAFVAVVASFGRGAAYLYAAGGLTPAAALAIGPVLAAPDGAVLLLAVAVPLATAALFLVDVGRELVADR